MEKEQKQEKFNKLVQCAENYIETKALRIINAIRKTEYKNCFEAIYEDEDFRYRPQYTIEELEKFNEKDLEKILIKRFCGELQNQSGRTNAIKYFSYNNDPQNGGEDGNNILLKVLDYYNDGKPEKYFWCELYEKFQGKENSYIIGSENNENNKACNATSSPISNCNKFEQCKKTLKTRANYGWREYCRGLTDALNYIKETSKEELVKQIKDIIIDGKPNERKKFLNNFMVKFRSIGQELVYDFFKELCCENLIKPDVHIKYLYKNVLNGQEKNSFNIAEDFIQMCNEYENGKYTPYYIDKILWLCCTGNFYKEDITINSINRENFINSYPELKN